MLRAWVKWFRGKRSKASGQRRPRRVRLKVEALEERVVPTVYFGPAGLESVSGGTVLSSEAAPVNVELVFWGPGWEGSPSAASNAVYNAVADMLSGPYLSGLGQYSTATRGTILQQAFVSSDVSGGPGDGGNVYGMLVDAMDHGALNDDQPQDNNPLVYLVVPQPGVASPTYLAGHGVGLYTDDDFPHINGLGKHTDTFYYVWTNNNGPQNAVTTSWLDTITQNLSWQLVNTVTNPSLGGTGLQTTNTNPPGQLGDYLGLGKLSPYAYRDSSGVLLNPYWSAADNHFFVPDGAAPAGPAISLGNNGVLTVSGDVSGPANDSITISQTSSGGVLVNVNNQEFAAFSPGQVSTININPGAGSNTVYVEAVPAGVSVNVNGSGNDQVFLGSNGANGGGTLANIQGQVTVANSGGRTTLEVNDTNDTLVHGVTLTSNSLTGLSPATISFGAGVTNLDILSSGSVETSFSVLSTPSNISTVLDCHGPAALTVGNNGSMQQIQGNLVLEDSIQGSAAPSILLHLDDSADPGNRTVTVANDSITGLAPAGILYQEKALSRLLIYGGSGNNNFTINDPGYHLVPGADFGTHQTVYDQPQYTNPVLINVGTGNDNVQVRASAAPVDIEGGSNNVTLGIAPPNLVVTGGGGGGLTQLSAMASPASASPLKVNLNHGMLSGLTAAAITWNPAAVKELDITDDSPGATYTINNPGPFPTDITTSNTSDQVTVLGNTGLIEFNGRILAEAATHFGLTLSTGNVVSGQPFSVTLTALDANNNPVPSYQGYVQISSDSFLGMYPYLDNTTLFVSNGQTFDVMPGYPGTATLTVTDQELRSISGTASVTISPAPGILYPFDYTPGPASQLVLLSQPSSGTAGQPLGEVQVEVEDASGNVVNTDNSTVTLTVASGPGDFASTSTVTATVSDGVATFTNLFLNTAGTYTLQASDGTLSPAVSKSCTVSAAPASRLVVTAGPPASVTAGAGFGLTVAAEDAFGNVDTSFKGKVTLALASDPGGSTLGGTLTISASNGIATFSGLTLDQAVRGYSFLAFGPDQVLPITNAFSVTAATATQLVVTTQPPTSLTAGAGFGLTVTAEDALGNVDTSFNGRVTLSLASNPGNATLGGTYSMPAVNGVATFTGLSLTQAGSGYVLIGSSGTLTAATSNPLSVTPGAATRLVLTPQPAGSVDMDTAFGLVVAAEDAYGNVATGYQGTVQFSSSDSKAVLPAGYTFAAADTGAHLFPFTPKTAGDETFKVTETSNNAVAGSATITVNRAAPTVSVADPGGPYNGSSYTASASATGVGGATLAGNFTYTYYSGTSATGTPLPGAPSSAGTYHVVATFASSDPDYIDGSAQASFTIVPAPPVVTSPPVAVTGAANNASTVGVFDPHTATWYLHNSNNPGAPDIAPFRYGAPGWIPVVGDWDGNGTTTLGVLDPTTETWYLRNTNSAGGPDITPFRFGAPGWIPLAGDWTGTGHTGIGVFDPATGTFYLRSEASGGAPDAGRFAYGAPGWEPVVGDWDGDGTTSVGVVDPATETWYVRNRNSPGAPDLTPFQFGAPGWSPVVGDWSGVGRAGIGAVDPSGAWYLRNTASPGAPESQPFAYGAGTWAPLAGAWSGPGRPLRVDGRAAPAPTSADALTPEQLQGVEAAALAGLQANGVSPALVARLAAVPLAVGSLGGNDLGMAYPSQGRAVLDATAAGRGWFVDPMAPQDGASGLAWRPMLPDLRTAVLQELGQAAGLSSDLLTVPLVPGVSQVEALDSFFATLTG
jgi:hypothetical protein